jgi:tRNA dimethylallyltransferase
MGSVLVICGPTAGGKTALAEALAQRLPLRLLSADSQLVYRGLDIGTAKPSPQQRAHWGLIDLVDPGQAFSAGEFCRQAAPLLQAAWAAGKLPALVGGTGLYLKALLEGLAEIPAVPQKLREGLEKELATGGLEPLLKRLDAADPALAAKLDRQNPRRVLRALEVFEATGLPLSHWQAETRPSLAVSKAFWLALDPGKDALDARIEARVQQNFRDGWLEEVQGLKQHWGAEAVCKSPAIGYPEVLQHLEGRLDLEACQQAILVQTRQYARRQRTWFKVQNDIHWAASAEEALALPALAAFLA